MTTFKLYISHLGGNDWFGSSRVINDEGNEVKYIVPADSLEQLRQYVKEGVDGDLGIADISFEEVFVELDENGEELVRQLPEKWA
jgi:hypothetical protein